MTLPKQGPFTKKVTDLPNSPSPNYTAEEIKEYMQTPADELLTTHNALVDQLTAGTAAGELGAKDGEADSTVQAVLDKLEGESNSLTTRMTSAEGEITSAKTRISSLESDNNVNMEDISSLQVLVSSATSKNNAQDTSISELDDRVTTAEDNINYNYLGIQGLDSRTNTIEARVNNLVGQTGQSNTEIVDARLDSGGTVHTTLKARLDSTDAQLAEKAKQIDGVKNFPRIAPETDDSPRLKRAITSLVSEGINVINLSSGTYELAIGSNTFACLELEGISDITIIGNPNSVLKQMTANKPIVAMTHCKNVKFIGVTFDGNKPTIDPNVYLGYGIVLQGNTENVTFDSCTFKNMNDTAITDRTQLNTSSRYGETTNTKKAYTIITNCHFENVKQAYNTKGGGARYIIIQGNHVKRSISGFKIDGETFLSDGNWTTYPNLTGQCVISENTFSDMIADISYLSIGNACVALQEYAEHMIVTKNIFDNIQNIDCISIDCGQSIKKVKHIQIEGNELGKAINSYGVVIRNDAGSDKISDVEIAFNTFEDFNYSMVYIKATAGETKRISLFKNTFKDWSQIKGESQKEGIDVYATGVNDNINLRHNTFIRETSTYTNKAGVRFNGVNSHKNKNAIERNDFLMKVETDYAITIDNSKCKISRNLLESGEIHLTRSVTKLSRNETIGSTVFLDSGTPANTVTLDANEFEKGTSTRAYAVRVGDGSAVTGKGNEFTGYTDPIYTTTGSYKEEPNLIITSPNGTHYKITVSDAGAFTATTTTI